MKPGLAQATKESLLAKYPEETPKREVRPALHPALLTAALGSFSGSYPSSLHGNPFTALAVCVCPPWMSVSVRPSGCLKLSTVPVPFAH